MRVQRLRFAALGTVLAGLALLVVSLVAFASYHQTGSAKSAGTGDAVRKQLETAAFHARNASNQAALPSARTHLGHALNCIEGTKGANFDASWGHVCQGQGEGILVDLQALPNAENVRLVVEAADSLALAGVKSGALEATRNAAKGVAALLDLVLSVL